MAPEIPLNINIKEPRWDQNTFLGRAYHFFTVTDPRNILLSNTQLENARKIVHDYRYDIDYFYYLPQKVQVNDKYVVIYLKGNTYNTVFVAILLILTSELKTPLFLIQFADGWESYAPLQGSEIPKCLVLKTVNMTTKLKTSSSV